jgi:hypothetical protein
MKFFTNIFAIAIVFAACTFLTPSASADEWNKKTTVTFSAPVEVPGIEAQVLPAGTYVFQLVDSLNDRHIVRITNERGDHVYTTILAIPNYRLRVTNKTVMTFGERGEGQPEAIRAWFYPGANWGEEFVYPKTKAIQLAQAVNQPVLYVPAEVTTVEALKTAPIEAVKPTGDIVPMTEVVEAPPAQTVQVETATAAPARLPNTAGYMPLMAGLGLLALCGAGLITKYSA